MLQLSKFLTDDWRIVLIGLTEKQLHKMVANHGNWQGKLEYAPLEQYGHGTWGTFEGLKVRLPEQYDAYLSQKYGNYRLDPPIEEQVGHHYSIAYDCNRSYKDML